VWRAASKGGSVAYRSCGNCGDELSSLFREEFLIKVEAVAVVD
jgi:hypothetical protein